MEGKDDASLLPRATVAKLVREILPEEIKFANDTIDLLLECCVEFIHLISSEANEICTKDKKNTITPTHIIQSLQALGFNEYIDEVMSVYDQHQSQRKAAPKKKHKTSMLSEEELRKKQEELFAEARSAMNNQQARQQERSGGMLFEEK